MPKLSEETRDFLEEKNMICRSGTVDVSGAPLVTPYGLSLRMKDYGSPHVNILSGWNISERIVKSD